MAIGANNLETMRVIPNEPFIAQLYAQCQENGEAIAIRDHGINRNVTRLQFLSDILAFSACIFQQLPEHVQISLTDRHAETDIFICVIMDSQYEQVVAYLGLYVLGATLVMLSPEVLPAEAEYFLSLSGAIALVVSPSRVEILNQIQTSSSVTRILLSSDMASDFGFLKSNGRLDDKVPMNPNKGLVLLLTSGTTGSPKGILHSRRSILAAARNLPTMWSLSSNDTALIPHPFLWIAGICYYSGLLYGGVTVELCETVLSPAFFWDRISAGGITIFSSTPPFYSMLKQFLEEKMSEGNRESNEQFVQGIRACRVLCTGSGYLADQLSQYWKDLRSGRPLVSTYGSTELGVPFCSTHYDASDLPPCCVGDVPQNVDINLRDGEQGELHVKTESIFKRYIKSTPGRQGEGFNERGFYMTGDTVRREGDRLFVLGRESHDVIRFNDWMVYAPAIENMLLSVPGIESAVVLGIADDHDGQEQIAALISLKKGMNEQIAKDRKEPGTTFLQSLHQHILTEKELPLYWLPTIVRLMRPEDEIPKNVRGKINKTKVREKFFNGDLQDMKNNGAIEMTTLAALSKYSVNMPFQRWAWTEH